MMNAKHISEIPFRMNYWKGCVNGKCFFGHTYFR
jgi:hypothetical protein